MFGHHRAKRAKKRLKREQESFKEEQNKWGEGAEQR